MVYHPPQPFRLRLKRLRRIKKASAGKEATSLVQTKETMQGFN